MSIGSPQHTDEKNLLHNSNPEGTRFLFRRLRYKLLSGCRIVDREAVNDFLNGLIL